MREYTGFMPVDKKRMGRPRRCVNNAINGLNGCDACYIEGYVVLDFGFPTVHAWNTIDGVPVDFTLPDPASCSFWGVPIPTDLVLMCARHRAWTLCTGCLETMTMMSPGELAAAAAILGIAS